MGHIIHDAVVVAVRLERQPEIDAFRASLPEKWRPLVVGPIEAITNHTILYAFLPDGSYEGWDISDDGNRYRQQFRELFSPGDDEMASVSFGRDLEDADGHGGAVAHSLPEGVS